MSSGIPVLLHTGVPDSSYHWLIQVLVILLITAAWVLLACIGDHRARRRRALRPPPSAPRPQRTVGSRIARRWVPHPRHTELTDTPRTPSR